jgi:hypothetical protein
MAYKNGKFDYIQSAKNRCSEFRQTDAYNDFIKSQKEMKNYISECNENFQESFNELPKGQKADMNLEKYL